MQWQETYNLQVETDGTFTLNPTSSPIFVNQPGGTVAKRQRDRQYDWLVASIKDSDIGPGKYKVSLSGIGFDNHSSGNQWIGEYLMPNVIFWPFPTF